METFGYLEPMEPLESILKCHVWYRKYQYSIIDHHNTSCHYNLCSQGRDTAELCGWIKMSSTAKYITDPGPTQVRGLVLDLDCTDELSLTAQK